MKYGLLEIQFAGECSRSFPERPERAERPERGRYFLPAVAIAVLRAIEPGSRAVPVARILMSVIRLAAGQRCPYDVFLWPLDDRGKNTWSWQRRVRAAKCAGACMTVGRLLLAYPCSEECASPEVEMDGDIYVMNMINDVPIHYAINEIDDVINYIGIAKCVPFLESC